MQLAENSNILQTPPSKDTLELIPISNNTMANEHINIIDHPPMTKDEKKGILILLLLYFIQGIPLGFFDSSIPLLLVEEGISIQSLGLLTFVSYPFALKLFFAPFEDIHFFKKFGKRKSYIIPCQYLLGFLFLISSKYIEEMIQMRELYLLTALGFIMILLAATQDIAVDGWVLTLLSEHHVGWGSACQSIGQTLGVICGSSVFIQLNSLKFCNKFIFSEIQNTPLLSVEKFFLIVGVSIIFINLYVHFFTTEKATVQHEDFGSVFGIVKSLGGFFKNKNLKFYLVFVLLWRTGFAAVGVTYSAKLIQKGYPKEIITTIMTCFIPLSFLITFLVGKFVKKGSEMKVFLICYLIKFVDNVFMYFLVTFYEDMNQNYFTILLCISIFFNYSYSTTIFVSNGAFINRISDADVGGTFLTFLNSVNNFGNMWSSSAIFYILGIFDYNAVVYISWLIVILFFFSFEKKIMYIAKLPKKEWSLKKSK